jgi:hypothetical protein
VRAEYLIERTEMALTADPASRFKYGPDASGRFADYFVKDGFYVEAELPAGPLSLLARWDGLRRRGNVLATSALSDRSSVYRYTAGLAAKLTAQIRLKMSIELYQFSDFDNDLAVHLGIATPF